MPPSDPDDPSFDDAMALLGVTPLAGGARKNKQAGKTRQSRQRQSRPRPPATRNPPRPDPRGPRARAPERGQTSERHDDAQALRELRELREQLTRAQSQLRVTQQERQRWQQEKADLEAGWQRERREVQQRRQREQSAQGERERKLHDQLRASQAAFAGRLDVRAALEARGCADRDEAVTVLRDLLSLNPDGLLDALSATSGAALQLLLEQRVAFVGPDVTMDERDHCVIVRVKADRCEITGGSDIQAAFRRFTRACQTAGVRQVTIVGGSPAYRRQLKRLHEKHGAGLRITLVSGTQRRTRKRAEADMRASDRVVIWGATELDHSVSAVYTGATDKLMRVPHRGISRMLMYVATELSAAD